jgi:hypothetical protein
VDQAGERVAVGRVLARRNLWPFFAGNLLSNSGTWFQNIAQVLLVYRLTGSSFLVGVVNFSQFAAVIFWHRLPGTLRTASTDAGSSSSSRSLRRFWPRRSPSSPPPEPRLWPS